MEGKIRVLVGKPGLDGHDRGARVIAAALRDAGMEVVYTGLRSSVPAIAAAAVQEDVDVIGLSILSGAHESICRRLVEELKKQKADIPAVVGGIIPAVDHEGLRALGVAAGFGPESPLGAVVETVRALASGQPTPGNARPAPAGTAATPCSSAWMRAACPWSTRSDARAREGTGSLFSIPRHSAGRCWSSSRRTRSLPHDEHISPP